MKNKLTTLLTLTIVFASVVACEFTTANLAEITFAENETSSSYFISANQGDKVYALSAIKNTKNKHTIVWKVTDSSGKEIQLPENEAKIEGARKIWLSLTLKPQVFPEGKYNFEVKLLNEKGDKEIDTKLGTLEVRN